MKLISEKIENDRFEIVSEAKNGSHTKHWYLRGIFGEAEIINRNRRKYPKGIMDEAVDKFQPLLHQENYNVYGEYHHPKSPLVNSLNACILMQNISMEGNKMLGEAKIMPNTRYGSHLVGLIKDAGHKPTVSTRALGDVTEKSDYNLVNEMTLITVDVVDNPSCPSAMPNVIYEDVNWMLDIGSIDGLEADLLSAIKRKDTAETYKRVMRDVNNYILEGFDNAVEMALLKLKYSL